MNIKHLVFAASLLGAFGAAPAAFAQHDGDRWGDGRGYDHHDDQRDDHGGYNDHRDFDHRDYDHRGGDDDRHGYFDGFHRWHWFAGYGPAYGYPPGYYAPPPPPPVYYAPSPYYAPPLITIAP